VTSVSNQGRLSGSNFGDQPTDDPDTTPAGDPTADTVATPSIVEIPALDRWGLALLVLLLAAAAAWRLRS